MTGVIISLSGGVGSWMAGRRWIDRNGTDDVVAVFADTKIEDPDLYRFLDDCERDLNVPLHRISEGRNPWEVFRDVRLIGNTRADPCSRVLKREMLHKWVEGFSAGEPCKVLVGVDFTESHRLPAIEGAWAEAGHEVVAPLTWRRELHKDDSIAALQDRGIKPPSAYAEGFPHNNCGGFCVKAGQAQFALLLKTHPDRYKWHEDQEQETRVHLGRDDVAILRDRRGGDTKPMTMREFRERVEVTGEFDGADWGAACSCIAPSLPWGDGQV